jgi:hypothetical protein
MYYVSMLRCWQLISILVKTNHLYLRVGRHSWYQSHYRYNISCTILFWKTALRICLDAHTRTIVVLTGGKLTGVYFLHLLYAIYFPVTTHLRLGRKVCILSPCDVNPGPVPSRWGLIEDSPYRAIGLYVRRVTSHDHIPRASGDLGMSCGHFRKTWICSCNV